VPVVKLGVVSSIIVVGCGDGGVVVDSGIASVEMGVGVGLIVFSGVLSV
jgi:hypothetical protein